eukprot:gnl/MRDRNA2_/MRDRNA2_107045_c0_seq1.p1 gnl/MRDRNA2_/MRDRNA2_107045_c0~~gnl/MRDRNA2_/MRDRNA2_107045_c0_seq1.p1  ORF type:complete len:346 (-),score=52.83 gnl/MRDRNA2_/MRDRNA2_107045_c0_seq1:83-1120(-)
MHPRNRHKEYLDYRDLAKRQPSLAPFVFMNKYGGASIDYTDERALRELTRSLLREFYGIGFWEIPDGYLCPPVPQRANYIHVMADLLEVEGCAPRGPQVCGLDIGTGANCIYCLLGRHEYLWTFIASDIDPVAIKSAQTIIDQNGLHGSIKLRRQEDSNKIFDGVLRSDEGIVFCICNPPFHESVAHARHSTQRKWRGLGRAESERNYQGSVTELCCDGGEVGFVTRLADESSEVAWRSTCLWFSAMVSRESSQEPVAERLRQVGAKACKIIPLISGSQTKWVMAWSFIPRLEREAKLKKLHELTRASAQVCKVDVDHKSQRKKNKEAPSNRQEKQRSKKSRPSG